MHGGSDPTGREPADSGRAERVACVGRAIDRLYSAARAADKKLYDEAAEKFSQAISEIEAAGSACERERGSEKVHGVDPEKAEVTPPVPTVYEQAMLDRSQIPAHGAASVPPVIVK